jgi:hypothetical protein
MTLASRCSILVALALLPAVTMAQSTATMAPPASAPVRPEYPQTRQVDGYRLVIHAPQIRTWPEFESFTADVAIELTPPGGTKPHLGTARVKGSTTLDMPKRLVVVRSPTLEEVKFKDTVTANETAAVQRAVLQRTLDVPLDLFLAYLADDVLSSPPPAGFNMDPPPILVRPKPTILLFVNGEAVPSPIGGIGLQRIVNANWPVVKDTMGGNFYLLEGDRWLSSSRLEGGWKPVTTLPAAFSGIPDDDEFKALTAAVPAKPSSRPMPDVVFAKVPTELIVTEGKPALELIAGTDGLQWVKNTESPLFKVGPQWYFLVAGRWFSSSNLEKGPWRFEKELPESFSAIPKDHPRADVRSSVSGTVEAKMAALEALLPIKSSVKKGSPPPVEVYYAGEPKFEAIPGTQVARAANTSFDILMYQDKFYFCYSAAWYVASSPKGPWAATAEVPDAIYGIPPSSPSFTVTDVKVVESDDDEIEYSSSGAYAAGMFVAFGIAYYGTGWYYPPYYYPPFYYPYWPTYGHGSWYNPTTGRYGSRSVWAGPYGGYSYNQAYNPRTGRYGYVETAWDGNEWASYGETYNPRTGVSSKTERYYNEDSNKLQTDRKVERGDEWVKTEKTRDFDTGTTTVERETSRGGSSETQRQNGQSVTKVEGAGGGQSVSVSGEGPGRTTIAQSGSGDLYAGHNGNVYKKTDDGWQQYGGGGQWAPAETPQRPESGMATQQPTRSNGGSARNYPSSSSLDRDYSARQRGSAQFQQRTGGGARMGGGFRGRR